VKRSPTEVGFEDETDNMLSAIQSAGDTNMTRFDIAERISCDETVPVCDILTDDQIIDGVLRNTLPYSTPPNELEAAYEADRTKASELVYNLGTTIAWFQRQDVDCMIIVNLRNALECAHSRQRQTATQQMLDTFFNI